MTTESQQNGLKNDAKLHSKKKRIAQIFLLNRYSLWTRYLHFIHLHGVWPCVYTLLQKTCIVAVHVYQCTNSYKIEQNMLLRIHIQITLTLSPMAHYYLEHVAVRHNNYREETESLTGT